MFKGCESRGLFGLAAALTRHREVLPLLFGAGESGRPGEKF